MALPADTKETQGTHDQDLRPTRRITYEFPNQKECYSITMYISLTKAISFDETL
jgi:hypothetical protein